MPENFSLVKGMKQYPQRVRTSKITETLLMTNTMKIFMAPENLPRVFRKFLSSPKQKSDMYQVRHYEQTANSK